MRKLILTALAAGALAAGGAARAQASGYDDAMSRGTIGFGPAQQYRYGEADRYGYRYGYPPPEQDPRLGAWRGDPRAYENRNDPRAYENRNDPRFLGNRDDPRVLGNRGHHRGNHGDRDRDGVANNRDRYPNDPSRW